MLAAPWCAPWKGCPRGHILSSVPEPLGPCTSGAMVRLLVSQNAVASQGNKDHRIRNKEPVRVVCVPATGLQCCDVTVFSQSAQRVVSFGTQGWIDLGQL